MCVYMWCMCAELDDTVGDVKADILDTQKALVRETALPYKHNMNAICL